MYNHTKNILPSDFMDRVYMYFHFDDSEIISMRKLGKISITRSSRNEWILLLLLLCIYPHGLHGLHDFMNFK